MLPAYLISTTFSVRLMSGLKIQLTGFEVVHQKLSTVVVGKSQHLKLNPFASLQLSKSPLKHEILYTSQPIYGRNRISLTHKTTFTIRNPSVTNSTPFLQNHQLIGASCFQIKVCRTYSITSSGYSCRRKAHRRRGRE